MACRCSAGLFLTGRLCQDAWSAHMVGSHGFMVADAVWSMRSAAYDGWLGGGFLKGVVWKIYGNAWLCDGRWMSGCVDV